MKLQRATFAAGCFWGVEELFRQTEGVQDTAVGYCGGHLQEPTYEQVCSEDTGHAEVVDLTFDSQKVSYQELLSIFWQNHNPTTLNCQGPDVGTQYRSVVFYHSEEQKQQALEMKEQLQQSGRFSQPIVTEITEFISFYKAEEYHQKYLKKKGLSSCQI